MDESIADIIIEPDDLLSKVIRYGERNLLKNKDFYSTLDFFKACTSEHFFKLSASEQWYFLKIQLRQWIIQTLNQKSRLN